MRRTLVLITTLLLLLFSFLLSSCQQIEKTKLKGCWTRKGILETKMFFSDDKVTITQSLWDKYDITTYKLTGDKINFYDSKGNLVKSKNFEVTDDALLLDEEILVRCS